MAGWPHGSGESRGTRPDRGTGGRTGADRAARAARPGETESPEDSRPTEEGGKPALYDTRLGAEEDFWARTGWAGRPWLARPRTHVLAYNPRNCPTELAIP